MRISITILINNKRIYFKSVLLLCIIWVFLVGIRDDKPATASRIGRHLIRHILNRINYLEACNS